MASVLNLQQNEYDPAIEKMSLLHDTAITTIEKMSKEIRELSELNGGFYIDKISTKIAILLDTLDSGVVNSMVMNMEASKESMENFADIITNLDAACDI